MPKPPVDIEIRYGVIRVGRWRYAVVSALRWPDQTWDDVGWTEIFGGRRWGYQRAVRLADELQAERAPKEPTRPLYVAKGARDAG